MQYFTNEGYIQKSELIVKEDCLSICFRDCLTITLHLKQDKKQTYKPNNVAGSLYHFRRGKPINIQVSSVRF